RTGDPEILPSFRIEGDLDAGILVRRVELDVDTGRIEGRLVALVVLLAPGLAGCRSGEQSGRREQNDDRESRLPLHRDPTHGRLLGFLTGRVQRGGRERTATALRGDGVPQDSERILKEA